MDQSYMKEKPIVPLVLKMALPMVVSMLVNSMYNIVDSFFVAQIGEDAMTALSLVFPLQNLANAVGVGFGIGIGAAVAYFLGAKKKALQTARPRSDCCCRRRTARRCAGCAWYSPNRSCGCSRTAKRSCNTRSNTFTSSSRSRPVITLEMAFEKILQAVGKMKTTMFCMAIGAVINIVLDPLFISGAGFIPGDGRMGAPRSRRA